MYQDAVKVPIGSWAKSRLKNLSDTDLTRDEAKNKSGFGKKVANWLNKDTVYPTNVLHLSTQCSNKNHSAAFPEELPAWFIKLFTEENGVILDPFVGSGTSAVAAKKLGRNYIGIDIMQEYCDLSESNLKEIEQYQFSLIESVK
jgi:DNA modification methylase